jgi:hypothetical protein
LEQPLDGSPPGLCGSLPHLCHPRRSLASPAQPTSQQYRRRHDEAANSQELAVVSLSAGACPSHGGPWARDGDTLETASEGRQRGGRAQRCARARRGLGRNDGRTPTGWPSSAVPDDGIVGPEVAAPSGSADRSAAHVPCVSLDRIPVEDRVDDTDNIPCIYGVHSRVARPHDERYIELMRRPGPPVRGLPARRGPGA